MQQKNDSIFWKKRGDRYVKKGEYTIAVYCYEVALRLNPENRSAWHNLRYTHNKLGNESEVLRITKVMEELAQKEKVVVVQPKKSILEEDLILFLIFFSVVWSLFYYYWLRISGDAEMFIGAAIAGLIAFIVTGWAWAFFFLWDSDHIFMRILALLMTGVIGGGIFILFRTVYSRILGIR